jgi:D-alanyl-lipoteichoic acid acyltransferase DltB (MBOAT superfamily)
MLFNSLDYALFLSAVLAIYWSLPRGWQNLFLLAVSYAFYGFWDWRFLGLIWLTTLIDWRVGIALGAPRGPRERRWILSVSLVANLGVLGFFKYSGFFATSLQRLLAGVGIELSPFTLDVVLPVGVSFYTFQALGYSIDVYRRRVEPARALSEFALFVAFFPQLVAGPIERAGHLLPQLRAPRRFGWAPFGAGGWLLLWGIFKKAVVADNLARLVEIVYSPTGSPPPTGGEALFGTFAFALQIYCDFSGYTDVARGTAKLLGFELVRNFDLPYLSASPSEFWRRWHISLSTWLRDYLYIPLGGNRRGEARTYFNLLVTMVLGGLWHGAAWTYVLWGAYHGVWLALHRALEPALARLAPSGRLAARVWRTGCVAVTFCGVCFGWVLFRAGSLSEVGRVLGSVADPRAGRAAGWLLPLAVLLAPLLLVEVAAARTGRAEPVLAWPAPLRVAVYTVIFYLIVFLGEDFGAPFIYFQF